MGFNSGFKVLSIPQLWLLW